jgi:hypothetical protein
MIKAPYNPLGTCNVISSMRQGLVAAILLATSTPAQTETSASEFLGLSGDRQATYVAGILQGMSYVMSNYDRAGYERWDACVRSQGLGATVDDVLRLLKENPNESPSPVPWAVTRAVTTRC